MSDYFPHTGISTKEVIHLHFDTIDSTNSWARRNVSSLDLEKITLLTADKQSAGRGRFQNKWESPACKNLYASFCLFVPHTQRSLGNIGQLMAISIAQILFSLNFKSSIKWPNDLFISSKKVGGILCETVPFDDMICVIIGVGLNINMPSEALEKIEQKATSLFVEKNEPVSVEKVTELIKKQFTRNVAVFLRDGFNSFVDPLRLLTLPYLNKKIHFHSHDKIWEGIFHYINQDGELQMRLASGEIKTFSSGEIIYNENEILK